MRCLSGMQILNVADSSMLKMSICSKVRCVALSILHDVMFSWHKFVIRLLFTLWTCSYAVSLLCIKNECFSPFYVHLFLLLSLYALSNLLHFVTVLNCAGICDYKIKGGMTGPNSCCSICTSLAECSSFTFYQGQCFLKKGCAGKSKSKMGRLTGAVSAYFKEA